MAKVKPDVDVWSSKDTDLVETLREAVAEANEALYATRQQLECHRTILARVHRSLLPSPVKTPWINVDMRYLPVDTLGSDYCQVRYPKPSVCYVTLCHVSGRGIAPALLATRVSSEVRHFILDGLGPSGIVRSLNAFMCEHFRDLEMRVSFMAACMDLDECIVTYSGAGHPGAMLMRPGEGVLRRLASQSGPVGLQDEIMSRQPECTQPLVAGDRLLFFSDGVIRAANVDNRQLGQHRLADFAAKALSGDLFDMADAILDQVARFRSGPAVDDLTLIVAEVK